jgi:hypothetical protein
MGQWPRPTPQHRGNEPQPPPADWPGRPRVGPSAPSGQRRQSDTISGERLSSAKLEELEELYKAGEAALARDDKILAMRYFERIAESYACLDVDSSALTPQLPYALEQLARMAELDVSRGVRSPRVVATLYRRAAEVWDRIAAVQEKAGMGGEARDTRMRASSSRAAADAAERAANDAQMQLRRLQSDEIASNPLGRIGRG